MANGCTQTLGMARLSKRMLLPFLSVYLSAASAFWVPAVTRTSARPSYLGKAEILRTSWDAHRRVLPTLAEASLPSSDSSSRVAMRPGLCNHRASTASAMSDSQLQPLIMPQASFSARAHKPRRTRASPRCCAESSLPSAAVLQASVSRGVLLARRDGWGVLSLSGADMRRFLHQQSTNAFEGMEAYTVKETVLTTATGRVRDLVTVAHCGEELLVLCSPGQAARLLKTFDMFIFPADKVALVDKSDEIAIVMLIGSGALAALDAAGLLAQAGGPANQRCVELVDGFGWAVAGVGLATPGVTLLLQRDEASAVCARLCEATPIDQIDEASLELLRILDGRPATGAELSNLVNPLEAALWGQVSFSKGCYIGQETIAKLASLEGPKQQLWGFVLAESPAVSDGDGDGDGGDGDGGGGHGGRGEVQLYETAEAAALGERAAGTLTSWARDASGAVYALGYVRRAIASSAGSTLYTAQGTAATMRDVPLARRSQEQCADAAEVVPLSLASSTGAVAA